jgi:uncharacterized membrane protein YedE/YeeE
MDYQSLSPIKKKGNARYLIGGTLFGLGWALEALAHLSIF